MTETPRAVVIFIVLAVVLTLVNKLLGIGDDWAGAIIAGVVIALAATVAYVIAVRRRSA